MIKEEELTLGEIRKRMEAVEDPDTEDTKRLVKDYLGSRLVGATMLGRGYAIGDPKEREAFAEWFVNLLDQVYRYAVVVEGDEEVVNKGEAEDE